MDNKKKRNNMNKFRKIASGVLACTVLLAATSCSDFLSEEQKTKRDTDYFKTEQGLIDLSVATYLTFKWHFSSENPISFKQSGTDEFWVGGDESNRDWNLYTANLSSKVTAVNSNTSQPNHMWDAMYTAINSANTIIGTADDVFGPNNTTTRDLIKGEAYFVRGFNYLNLVMQYGAVPLKLNPSDGVERYFTRQSVQEVMEQVISDLESALSLLPATASKTGKLYKDAARHFLAKAHLFRASEINDSWNSGTKSADLQSVISYADQVISSHPLASDFGDLWYFTEPDSANERNPEVIFSAQYTENATANYGRNSNRFHFYFTARYQTMIGMTRDIAGGREYQRMKTTEYIFDVFDLENDSRFWKSYRTKMNLNNRSNIPSLYSWTADGQTVTVPWSYSLGDLGVIFIINKKGDQRYHRDDIEKTLEGQYKNIANRYSGVYHVDPATNKPVPHAFVRYQRDNTEHIALRPENWPTLGKYLDGSRETLGSENGQRDGILARSADTYLMKAEALIRQNNYNEAINVINVVRQRAQYKAGEDRSAYWDGGGAYLNNTTGQSAQSNLGGIDCCSFHAENSYYESLDIPVSTAATDLTNYSVSNLPAADEAIITKLGYSSEYDRMMCFLLNERSRELAGELVRWEDLARTKTLEARVRKFNYRPADPTTGATANFNASKHYLRPIPQEFLDQIQTEDGRALTSEEKSAMQNPGY